MPDERLSAAAARLTAAVDRLESLANGLGGTAPATADPSAADARIKKMEAQVEKARAESATAQMDLNRSKAAYTDLQAVAQSAAVRLDDAAERIAALIGERQGESGVTGDGRTATPAESSTQPADQ